MSGLAAAAPVSNARQETARALLIKFDAKIADMQKQLDKLREQRQALIDKFGISGGKRKNSRRNRHTRRRIRH